MPNAHSKSTWINDIAIKCSKKKCSGTLIHCFVTYGPNKPTVSERECSDCGQIKKSGNFQSGGFKSPRREFSRDRRPDKYRTNRSSK